MNLPDLLDSVARLRVRKNSGAADVGARRRLNFIEGDNVTLTVTDDPTGEEIDVTITAASGDPGDAWTVVTKANDESVSSSTSPQNDDELFFTAASGEFYEIEIYLIFGSPAGGGTPDLRCDFGEDSTTRGGMNAIGVFPSDDSSSTAAARANQTDVLEFGTAVATRAAKVTGMYAGAGGTFRLRWSQRTSGANATTVYAGSFLRYRTLT